MISNFVKSENSVNVSEIIFDNILHIFFSFLNLFGSEKKTISFYGQLQVLHAGQAADIHIIF